MFGDRESSMLQSGQTTGSVRNFFQECLGYCVHVSWIAVCKLSSFESIQRFVWLIARRFSIKHGLGDAVLLVGALLHNVLDWQTECMLRAAWHSGPSTWSSPSSLDTFKKEYRLWSLGQVAFCEQTRCGFFWDKLRACSSFEEDSPELFEDVVCRRFGGDWASSACLQLPISFLVYAPSSAEVVQLCAAMCSFYWSDRSNNFRT